MEAGEGYSVDEKHLELFENIGLMISWLKILREIKYSPLKQKVGK